MYPKLLHIYSDFYLNSYGLAIAVGLALFSWLLSKDKPCQRLTDQSTLFFIIQLGFIAGLFFGRVGVILTSPELFDHWYEWFMIWQGGFSLLATVFGILLVVPLYLYKKKIALLPFLDRVAIYAPLLQSIARIGCFLAGCCAGKETTVLWGITYTDPACTAQLYTPLHPAQLYSSLLLFVIFLLMYYVLQYRVHKPGSLLYCYLILMSLERFCVDFFRADQLYFQSPLLQIFSIHQWIALVFFVGASIALLFNHRSASL